MVRDCRTLFGEQRNNLKTRGRTTNEPGNGVDRRGVNTRKFCQRDGDWSCPDLDSGNMNFAFRGVCNLCGAARPTSISGTGIGRSQTVRIKMTVEDFIKWQQFKRTYMNGKLSMEAADSCGNVSKVVNNQSLVPWLIDSGAPRHMAGSYNEFSKYAPNVKEQGVKLADGSTQAVMGTGTVVCGSNIPLSSVLHVPSFPINLLSISCITKELNCAAIFYPTWCSFVEIGTGRELGRGSMHNGLYYLDSEISPMVAAALSSSPLREFLLLHHRLGHMPFGTMGTSEQNGLAERKNRHLLEVTRCLMIAMNVPKYLWSEAVMTAAYLINRMPSRVLNDKTPIECLTGKNSYIVPPKVFGCVCFVKDHRPSIGKLDSGAVKCIFVGYSGKQKGYKCWCLMAVKYHQF